MRFAKDFTKLSEYFGPDDYDRNLNLVETLNANNNPHAQGVSNHIESNIVQARQKPNYTRENKTSKKLFFL